MSECGNCHHGWLTGPMVEMESIGCWSAGVIPCPLCNPLATREMLDSDSEAER